MVSRDRLQAGNPEARRRNILIVKLGAFGNIILSLGAFRAIRRTPCRARISVLTSAGLCGLAADVPLF